MELWIRSQDKESLLKPISISLDNLKTSIFGYYSDDYYKVLGRYKSKERALEVLDEIQKMLSINININADYEEADLLIKSSMLCNMVKIYEMPKE